jgi:hypothetical protein
LLGVKTLVGAQPKNMIEASPKKLLRVPVAHHAHTSIGSVNISLGKGADKAYALLREALAASGKLGFAQFVLSNRHSLCVLKAQGNALTLIRSVLPKRFRPPDGLRLSINEKLVAGEIKTTKASVTALPVLTALPTGARIA